MISKLFDAGAETKAVLTAIGKSLAMIEFDLDGHVLTANKNFCALLGYDLSEIVGKHHSLFVKSDHAACAAYKDFWAKLGRGECEGGEYKHVAKGGKGISIQASYSPVVTAKGKVTKIVEIASDVTAQKLKAIESDAKLDALSRVQAVIEFTPDGRVLTANDNFLQTLGYQPRRDRRAHAMFVESAHAQSADYREFWAKLGRGEYVAQEFKRIGKGGKEVWIQASYNPVFDQNGKVMKVIKFATEVTDRVRDVNEIGSALEHLSKGDLFWKIEKPVVPALEKLRTDFNHARSTLKQAMWDVGGTALAIQKSTGEIKSSADELAKRTEQQAASLEETAAALNEITATVRTTAAGAKHACEVVGGAKVGAEHSGDVVTPSMP